jgi:hypothetical protein
MRKPTVFCLLFAAGALALAAGPPYTTDDPETPRRRGWEINLPLIIARSSALRQAQIPLFDLNYGFSDSFQFDLEIPIYRVGQPGQASATGLGDVMVGVKWRFLEESKSRPQVAFYPQVCLPTGNAARGLGAGAPCYIFPISAEKNLGKWTVYTNVGYAVQKAVGAHNYFYYGAAVTREVAAGLEIGAEIFGNAVAIAGAGSDDGFTIGAELQISRSLVLLGSAGHSFHGGGTFLAYVGLQILTGPNRRPRS